MAGPANRPGALIEGINVTPMVDITLVLLVIFIVTAKIIVTPAVPLDLPRASHSEAVQTIFAVTIPPDGVTTIEGRACSDDELEARARSARAQDPDLRAVIQADGAVPHRRVVEVLDLLGQAGIERVAFGAVEPEPEGATAMLSGR